MPDTATAELLDAAKEGLKAIEYVIGWYTDMFGDEAITELPTETRARDILRIAIKQAERMAP